MNQLSLLGAPPPTKRGPRDLRDYQDECVEAIFATLATRQSTLAQMFCGAGKTRTVAEVVKRWPGRVLWLARTDYLLDQAVADLQEVCGQYISLEKGSQRADAARVVVGSIMTLKGKRLRSHDPDSFSLLVFDEAHESPAPTPFEIAQHFSSAKRLGMSATPFRMDKRPVIGPGALFETICFKRDVHFGITEGFFVPVRPSIREVKSVDLSALHVAAGDFALGELEKEIAKSVAPIARVLWEESNFGELPALCYTPGVASAKGVAATFNEYAREKWGSEACVSVDGDSEPGFRRYVKENFGGKIRAVANCNILTQGVDLPAARLGLIARPTQSPSLFEQMACRPGRTLGVPNLPTADERHTAIAASPKPFYKLVDIAGNAGRHTICSVVSVMGGELTSSEKTHAERVIRRKPGVTLDEAVKEGKKAAAEEEKAAIEGERKRIAEAAAAARVEAISKAWDPFTRLGAKPDGIEPQWSDEPASPSDVEWLKKNRLPYADVSTRVVKAMRDQSRKWHEDGRASFRQRALLMRAPGCPIDVSFAQASRLADKILKGHYKRLTAEQIAECMQRQPGEEG